MNLLILLINNEAVCIYLCICKFPPLVMFWMKKSNNQKNLNIEFLILWLRGHSFIMSHRLGVGWIKSKYDTLWHNKRTAPNLDVCICESPLSIFWMKIIKQSKRIKTLIILILWLSLKLCTCGFSPIRTFCMKKKNKNISKH